jgi:hypothetical protein
LNGEIECSLQFRAVPILTGLPANFPVVVPAEVRYVQVDDNTMLIDGPRA